MERPATGAVASMAPVDFKPLLVSIESASEVPSSLHPPEGGLRRPHLFCRKCIGRNVSAARSLRSQRAYCAGSH